MRFQRIVSSFLSLLFISGVIAMAGTSGFAQRYGNRSWDGYPNWGGNGDLRQTALNQGFNDGMKAGANDRARNRQTNFNDFREYRNANRGYSSRFGDRELYSRYYRVGFEHGYAENFPNNNGNWNGSNNGNWNGSNNGTWNGNNNGTWNNGGNGTWSHRGRDWGSYGNYGGSDDFRQTALNAGYNEGIKQGRKDRNRGPRNLNDFSQFRNANTDYDSRNGDLGMYQRYYREGFENGYYDGLNGY